MGRNRCFSADRLAVVVSIALWVLTMLLLPAGSAGADSGPAIDPHQQQHKLEKLRQRIRGLRERIQQARGEHSSLSDQLEQSEQEIGRLARRLRVLRGRLQRQQARLLELRQSEREQQQALRDERDLLEQQVRAAYAMGRQEQLKILLNQQDPAVVSRVLAYYDYLNRERIGRMQHLRDGLARLHQTQNRIGQEQQRLEKLQAQRLAEMQGLEQAQSARREVLVKLDSELSDHGQELTRLQADEQQLQTLLKGLREALLDIPAAPVQQKRFQQLQGALQWPVRGTLRHAFGEPKIGALRWDGVMIGAAEGDEVRAVHAGRVAFADWLRGFGLLLIVDHGNGYMTLYGHNQSLFKEAGEWVETGEPVAAVGSTGGRKDSGVYFAIRHHGKAVNPVKWCRGTRGRKVG